MVDAYEECRFEEEVLMNLESGDIKPHIKEHMAGCALCRETEKVFMFMDRFQHVSLEHQFRDKKLPSAEALWADAYAQPSPIHNLVREPDTELIKKALLPVIITQWVTYAVIAFGIIYLIASNFSQIAAFFNLSFGTSGIAQSVSKVVKKSGQISILYLIPPVIALIGVLAFLFYSDDETPQKGEISAKHI